MFLLAVLVIAIGEVLSPSQITSTLGHWIGHAVDFGWTLANRIS
jgi:hypothetical protein